MYEYACECLCAISLDVCEGNADDGGRGGQSYFDTYGEPKLRLCLREREGGTASRVVAIRGSLVQLLSRQFYACMPSKHTHTHTTVAVGLNGD